MVKAPDKKRALLQGRQRRSNDDVKAILKDPFIAAAILTRLELIDGNRLRDWLTANNAPILSANKT
jgi:hypothetical protein